jgi:hypothetical protein
MAAGGVAGNVQLGPGRLYYAPLGTAEPTSASAALPSAWKVVGYTEEGTAIETELTSEAIEVAEELDPIRYVMTKRASRVVFTMVEATVSHLALALGAGAATTDTGTAFEFPDPDAIVAVMFVWDKLDVPGSLNRRWVFRQCTPSGTIALTVRKAPAKSAIPVTFNVEKPSTAKPVIVYPNAAGQIA